MTAIFNASRQVPRFCIRIPTLLGKTWLYSRRSRSFEAVHLSMKQRDSSSAVMQSTTAVVEYHERTKHHLYRYAAGPQGLDWANQPDPFRQFSGSKDVRLVCRFDDEEGPSYDGSIVAQHVTNHQLDLHSLSQFLYYSVALSAWKQLGTSKWSLRVNPSSGNLHPTEAYIVSAGMPGLNGSPAVLHYRPDTHSLELRAELPPALATQLFGALPAGSFLVGLTSIHWRESWKYGERALRYCLLDTGHALGALAASAATLGWQVRLLCSPSSALVEALLGLHLQSGPEREWPECLVAVMPSGPGAQPQGGWEHWALDEASILQAASGIIWHGTPNTLSTEHRAWPVIAAAAAALAKPATAPEPGPQLERAAGIMTAMSSAAEWVPSPLPLRRIIRQRRSAVDFDGSTSLTSAAFFRILRRTLHDGACWPWNVWPGRCHVSLLLFVHRVQGLQPGLYFLARDPTHLESLRDRRSPYSGYSWAQPAGCPADLPLYLLVEGDARDVAKKTSCAQDIASDGVFCVAMLAEFEGPLREEGAWAYAPLHWECGLLGQVLYLEAEALGIMGTGIGCFMDDLSHSLANVSDKSFQTLYHFTVGGGLTDSRLSSLPAYKHLGNNA